MGIGDWGLGIGDWGLGRSEEHTSELQSLREISYAVFCLKKKKAITEPASSSPDKIGFQLLTIVDQQVLARHAAVDAGQVVTEVCNLFCGSPFVQECLIQALPHEVGIINDMGIEGSQYPARGNTCLLIIVLVLIAIVELYLSSAKINKYFQINKFRAKKIIFCIF